MKAIKDHGEKEHKKQLAKYEYEYDTKKDSSLFLKRQEIFNVLTIKDLTRKIYTKRWKESCLIKS